MLNYMKEQQPFNRVEDAMEAAANQPIVEVQPGHTREALQNGELYDARVHTLEHERAKVQAERRAAQVEQTRQLEALRQTMEAANDAPGVETKGPFTVVHESTAPQARRTQEDVEATVAATAQAEVPGFFKRMFRKKTSAELEAANAAEFDAMIAQAQARRAA
jgi:hypothetical protein